MPSFFKINLRVFLNFHSDLYTTQRVNDPETSPSGSLHVTSLGNNSINNNNTITLSSNSINTSPHVNVSSNSQNNNNSLNHNHSQNHAINNQRLNTSAQMTAQPLNNDSGIESNGLSNSKQRQQSEY